MSIKDKFVFEKRFTVEDIDSAVPELGLKVISDRLLSKYGYTIPSTFDFRWVVTDSKSDYQGTFPKRLAALFHNEFGVQLPADDKEWIGYTAKKYVFSRPKYEYEFTRKINWKSGDFGDSGSCFWSGKDFARAMLVYNGSVAIRFFDGKKGWGRAWIHFSKYHPDSLFIANAYPKGFALDQVALILSKHFDLEYKPIHLVNEGTWEGVLWINQGRGIVLFPKGEPFISDKFDLGFSAEWVICPICKKKSGSSTIITEEGDILCSKCSETLYFRCKACHANKLRECGEAKVNGYSVCLECFDKLAPCLECKEKALELYKGLCMECYNKIYIECAHCSKTFRRDEARHVGMYRYCKECYENNFSECVRCGTVATKRPMRELSGGRGYVCPNCISEYARCRHCDRLHKRGERCTCRPKDDAEPEEIPKEEMPSTGANAATFTNALRSDTDRLLRYYTYNTYTSSDVNGLERPF